MKACKERTWILPVLALALISAPLVVECWTVGSLLEPFRAHYRLAPGEWHRYGWLAAGAFAFGLINRRHWL